MKEFFKYTGSSKRYADRVIDDFLEGGYDTYLEPFVGGGSCLLNLLQRDDLDNNISIIINDLDFEVHSFYKSLKKYPLEYYIYFNYGVDAIKSKECRELFLLAEKYIGKFGSNRGIDNLQRLSKALQRVEIYNTDYSNLNADFFKDKSVFTYVDPPYRCDIGSRYYKHNDVDYVLLAEHLRGFDGFVASLEDSFLSRAVFEEYEFEEVENVRFKEVLVKKL